MGVATTGLPVGVDDHPTGLSVRGPRAGSAGGRIEAVHPLSGDVNPPEAGADSVPDRTLGMFCPQVECHLDIEVTHANPLP
jgi:hypothetical protein